MVFKNFTRLSLWRYIVGGSRALTFVAGRASGQENIIVFSTCDRRRRRRRHFITFIATVLLDCRREGTTSLLPVRLASSHGGGSGLEFVMIS